MEREMSELIYAEGDILAAVDVGGLADAVTDAGAWVARRTQRPLTLLQAIERPSAAIGGDLSGSLAVDSQDTLLAELAALDERRAQLLQRSGRRMLDALAARLGDSLPAGLRVAQRHGAIVDVLLEAEPQVRLFVMGRQGVAQASTAPLGRHVERAIRAVSRPVLVVPGTFVDIRRAVIAFDASPTATRCVAMVAASPLLAGVALDVVMVGNIDAAKRVRLDEAVAQLCAAGLQAQAVTVDGEAESALLAQLERSEADLLVMGAYGHSRIRHLLVGSTTTALLRRSPVPVLLLR